MTTATLVPGIYNSTPPTLGDGDQAQLQMDASGNLKVNASVTIDGVATEVTLGDVKTAVEALAAVISGASLLVQGDAAGTAVFVQPGGGAEFSVNLGATDNAVLDAIAASLASVDDAVSGAGFNITQLAGAAVPIGAGTEAAAVRVTVATDSTGVVSVDDNGASLTVDYATTGSGTATGALRVELPTNGTGVIATVGAVTAITNALPAGTNAIGRLAGATTGTQSIVAGSASDVTILAANSARYGASVYNDSTATLYLLLANTTSSATVYSVKMLADDYFEAPAGYTGIIKGIWASATGSARVMEYT